MMEAAKKMFGCKCNYQRDMDKWGERVKDQLGNNPKVYG